MTDAVEGTGVNNKLKVELDSANTKLTSANTELEELRLKVAHHDNKTRDVISSLQPEINSFVAGLVKENQVEQSPYLFYCVLLFAFFSQICAYRNLFFA